MPVRYDLPETPECRRSEAVSKREKTMSMDC